MPHWTDLLDPEAPNGAYLPWKKVEPRVGISRTTAWRLQKSGDFPKPYVVSPGRVAYRESEVEAWRASRGHRGAEPSLALNGGTTPSDRSSALPPTPARLALEAPIARPGQSQRRRVARRRPAPSNQMSFDF